MAPVYESMSYRFPRRLIFLLCFAYSLVPECVFATLPHLVLNSVKSVDSASTFQCSAALLSVRLGSGLLVVSAIVIVSSQVLLLLCDIWLGIVRIFGILHLLGVCLDSVCRCGSYRGDPDS